MGTVYNVSETFTENQHILSFSVRGKPSVQLRPRICFKKRVKSFCFDPSSKNKQLWRANLKEQIDLHGISTPAFGSDPLIDMGITVKINFYMRRPNTDYCQRMKARVLKSTVHKYPKTKDLDNMVKFLLDAMQPLLYHNDSAICTIICSKQFVEETAFDGEEPYTTIDLTQQLPLIRSEQNSILLSIPYLE